MKITPSRMGRGVRVRPCGVCAVCRWRVGVDWGGWCVAVGWDVAWGLMGVGCRSRWQMKQRNKCRYILVSTYNS